MDGGFIRNWRRIISTVHGSSSCDSTGIHSLLLDDATIAGSGLDKASTTPRAPLAAKVRCLLALTVLARATSDADENGGDEEGGGRAPGEAIRLCAETCILAVGAEIVAGFDGPCAEEWESVQCDLNQASSTTHVMSEEQRAWNMNAARPKKPAM
jgi:hypothetical protein